MTEIDNAIADSVYSLVTQDNPVKVHGKAFSLVNYGKEYGLKHNGRRLLFISGKESYSSGTKEEQFPNGVFFAKLAEAHAPTVDFASLGNKSTRVNLDVSLEETIHILESRGFKFQGR